MKVRDATVEDLPMIVEIYNHAVIHSTATADYEPQTVEARRQWFDERQAAKLPVLVAEEDGMVVAWASLNPYRSRPGWRFTVENSVYVHAERRGRGAGKKLLVELIVRSRQLGHKAILAAIDSANEASLALHAQLGFEKVGYLPRVIFKFDRWLDVVYLLLAL